LVIRLEHVTIFSTGAGQADSFPDRFGLIGHLLFEGCNIPVGWAGHFGWIAAQENPADMPSSESTAAGFAFNIPVRVTSWACPIGKCRAEGGV
jgi:hypothetical protein